MPHDTPLIATIVAGLGLAFVLGAIANRFRLPPLVGYLIAGILVGPHTPGFVADQHLAPELAELGVILLMFGVGLHFSLKDLMSVRAIALPGAVAQILAATAMGTALGLALGWSLVNGIVLGFALSCASTVVLLRAVQERRLIDTDKGRIAVGWLIVEDLAMVVALVLLPALSRTLGGTAGGAAADPLIDMLGGGVGMALLVTLAKVAAFIVLMLVVGRRVIPWTLHAMAHTGSRELFRLSVLAIALGVAYGSAKLFGVSLALGAFFAGMILSESALSHQAAQETLPLRDAFSVLFFVAVGMLFDPRSLAEDPLPILIALFIVIFGKSIAAYFIVKAFRHPTATALTISASLAQIGEFSFILAELGIGLGLLPEEARSLILASALLSICLNPFAFALADRVEARHRARHPEPETVTPEPAVPFDAVPAPPQPGATRLRDHVVVVGYGRVGSRVGEALADEGRDFLVIEDGASVVAALREAGVETIVGNAARSDTLADANLERASHLVVAIPNAFEAGQVVEQGREQNPGLKIIARAHSDAEVEHLLDLGADVVIMGEREIARGMIEHVTGAA